MQKICAIVVAAGQATRFHSNKLLYKINSKWIISYVIDNVSHSNFYRSIIVLRNQEIQDYSIKMGFKAVWNCCFEKGMSASIVKGLENIPPECDAVMIIPGDMPLVTSEYLNGLINHYELSGSGISGFEYNGEVITPVIFSKKYFPEILQLTGDKGAKSIVKKHFIDFSPLSIGKKAMTDIDTLEDAKKVEKILNNKA
ncbi:nucleotidyltransferase family protein [Ferroplasma sp.]|uniref:nucleotidyltransferase family protein n=1 Tax=Ferroplasma sp. TaxID=2591003 RepID=UPI00307E219D